MIRRANLFHVVLGLGGLLALSAAAMLLGHRSIAPSTLIEAFQSFDPTNADHVVATQMRLPRLLSGLLAGASLGVAGALMQGLTRNPLADPGLLGVNAGAAVAVVVSIVALGNVDPSSFIWPALIGGSVASLLVYMLGGLGRSQSHPARLVLAGVAVSALALALTRGVLILSQQSLDTYRFWVLGGLGGISLADLQAVAPFAAVGLGLGVAAAFMLNALLLGEDTARALGIRVGLAQWTTGLAIVLLCTAVVCVAGPIAFVGLIVPHVARRLFGPDMRTLILFSAVIGAALLLAADILGRFAPMGGLDAGTMIAFLGGPALILLARRHREVSL